MLRSSQSGRVYQAASPRLTCVEQEIRVVQGNFIFQSYCAVGCCSQTAGRLSARLPGTERPLASPRPYLGRAWKEGTRRHRPGPSHSPPSLATGRTSAEDWAGRPPASFILESGRLPMFRAPGRRGCALCVGEGSCFYGLHKRESALHTACQTQFLSCKSAPRLPPRSPTPVSPTPPRTAKEMRT